jgi:hypothetical protein
VLYVPALRWADGAFGPDSPAGEEGLALVSRWPILERRALRLPFPRPTEARILLSARWRRRPGRSGSTPPTSTTGSTTARRARRRCWRSTTRSARAAAATTIRRSSCVAI